MTTPTKQDSTSNTAQHQEVSLDRISRLISDLEQELANTNIPHANELRQEIDTLKQIIASPDSNDGGVRDRLHAVHKSFQDMTARVEGEVLRDSPYIAEIGRILGLV